MLIKLALELKVLLTQCIHARSIIQQAEPQPCRKKYECFFSHCFNTLMLSKPLDHVFDKCIYHRSYFIFICLAVGPLVPLFGSMIVRVMAKTLKMIFTNFLPDT